MMNLQIDPTAFDYPDISIPALWTVRQKVEAPCIDDLDDVEGATRSAMEAWRADPRLRPGASSARGRSGPAPQPGGWKHCLARPPS